MRNLILLFVAICFNVTTSKAQAPFMWDYYDYFGDGYPIVTQFFQKYFDNWKVDDINDHVKTSPLTVGDAIMNVNGKDAKTENGMEEFYRTPHINMTIYRHPYGFYNFSFDNLLYNPENVVGDLHTALHFPIYLTEQPGISIVKAKNIDFTSYRTYDFLIDSNDPLVDEEILTYFVNSWAGHFLKRMQRNTENPDIIFRVAKSADESISATYVPPTKETINTGSVTQPVYNYITRTTSYVTRQKNQTVTTPGHTEMTKLSNIYLEVVGLDAKKLNDPNQKTPPEIWKMTYTSQNINGNKSLLEMYKVPFGGFVYPFDLNISPVIGIPFSTGAFLMSSDDKKTLLVGSVAPGTPAAKLGLQAGDRILKINGKDKFDAAFYTQRWSLGEETLLLGDLDFYGCITRLNKPSIYAAYILTHIKHELGILPNTSDVPDYIGPRIKALAKEENEFLIERDGKKIKLNGQLWDPHFFDMRLGEILPWARSQGSFYLLQAGTGRYMKLGPDN